MSSITLFSTASESPKLSFTQDPDGDVWLSAHSVDITSLT